MNDSNHLQAKADRARQDVSTCLDLAADAKRNSERQWYIELAANANQRATQYQRAADKLRRYEQATW